MAELVTIPVSFIEITSDYERPVIGLLIDRGEAVQGIFDALGPWNPNIDDVETITTGKHSEQGVAFRLPLKRVSFFFGAALCRFSRDNADWESAAETINILEAVQSALVRLGRVVLGTKRIAIGMHLQPKTISFVEILKPFLAQQLATLENDPVQTMAVVAKWGKRRVTLDGSAVLANAVFLKIEREFNSASTYTEIAQQLQTDEVELFKILGIEEDRG